MIVRGFCKVDTKPLLACGGAPGMFTNWDHVVAILMAPPPTRRYLTGVVAEGVSGELRLRVQSGVGLDPAEGASGELLPPCLRVPATMGSGQRTGQRVLRDEGYDVAVLEGRLGVDPLGTILALVLLVRRCAIQYSHA